MIVRHISNATCLYEAADFRLLADPWLTESCFEGAWLHSPPINATPQDYLDVDALYISHLHEDHADPQTLKHFRRDIPIVTLGDANSFCAKHLLKMGFTDVSAMADHERRILGPFAITMFGPFVAHPFHGSEIGNVVDSAIRVAHGKASVLNCNDNTMSIDAAREFVSEFGRPTLAQLNSNAAGPYPGCFLNLSHDEKIAEKTRILQRQTQHMVDIAKELGAKVVQPFAGQYRLGGDVAKLNEYLAAWSDDEIAEFCRARDVNAVVLREGETLDVGNI